jgi:ABC-type Fe3+ transport system permease subunit
VKKAPLVIAILSWLVGSGLIIAGSASNGFHACGNSGGKYGGPIPPPCPHSVWLPVIAGLIVIILGMLMAFAARALTSRHPERRNRPSA